MSETIFALATAPGRAAIAVLRISGPAAGAALCQLSGRDLPPARQAVRRRLRDPASGETLDRALALWFPGPASYSGEDLVELQLHGGPAVIEGVLAALARLPGLRLAEPGEFTRRAFLAGKLDLTEVEGLADLIAAETAAQRRQALAQAGGALARRAAAWRERLVTALAQLEAALDFADEELPGDLPGQARATALVVAAEIADALADEGRGERLRRGLAVALVGAPNAGKSSLLNALVGRAAAIVSARAGTTRDPVEVHLDLQGLPLTLVDSAGLAAAPLDEVDAEAMRRARALAATADLRLEAIDLNDPGAATLALPAPTLRIGTKADLPLQATVAVDLSVSARSGAGLAALRQRLTDEARRRLGDGAAALVARPRQRQALETCRAALVRAASADAPELTAEDLRLALRALAWLAGRVDVEEVLDRLFRDFCIGK